MSFELGRRHGPSKPKEFGAIEAQQLDLGGVLPMTPALQIPGHLVFRPDLLPAARLLSPQPPSSSCPLLSLSSSFRLADNLLLDKFEIKAVHTSNQHTSHCPTASPVPTLRISTPRYINSPRTGLIVAASGIILRDPFSHLTAISKFDPLYPQTTYRRNASSQNHPCREARKDRAYP